MSCNHCSTKFNFFHKEVGCANCGLSFCSKCLKQKIKIPNKGAVDLNVCRACFFKLSAGTSTSSQSDIAPPEAFMKRLEALENPVAPPITMYKNDRKMSNLRRGLSPADLQLVERLEKLKDDGRGPPPSECEIRRRLADLRSENNYVDMPPKQLPLKDSRTDQEKADELLEHFTTEREIELVYNPQNDIEARLASLRKKGVRPNEGEFIKNLHDSASSSEEEVDKITKKIMDEVALESRLPKSMVEDPDDLSGTTSPELPWCVLCNSNAKFRCYDCGGDLYCAECNTEAHRNWGDTDHKVTPYKPK